MRRTAWLIVVLAVVLEFPGPALAGRKPLSDEELNTILAGQVRGSRRRAAEPPFEASEFAEVSLVTGGVRVTRRVRSLREIRKQGVVLQNLDFSCGAAALSTVATYFLQDPTTEADVIATILVTGQTPQEGVRKYMRRRGFTLLDLKRASEARRYKAVGYRGMTFEDLVETIVEERAPVLVPINPFGYYHFVVVRGIQGDRVFLADPAVGKVTMKISRFEDVWVDGIGFVVTRPRQAASSNRATLASATDSNAAPVTDAGAPAAQDQSSSTGKLEASSSLLEIKPDETPSPESSWLMPTIARTQTAGLLPVAIQSFDSARGEQIISSFMLYNYQPAVQFGRPAGNFTDFSPPPGEPITIR